MLNIVARLLLIGLLIAAQGLRAGTDGDLLYKQIQGMPKENDARGANALIQALTQTTSRSKVAKHFADRRQYDMMTNDLQDLMSKMTADDAQKVFATHLPRAALETQVAMCFGLKMAPANADVDAAALKLLVPAADNKLKVALMDLLAYHRVAAAVDKILPLLTTDSFPSVQITACRALALLPDKRTIPAVLKYMEAFRTKGNGRLMYEATATLRSVTGMPLNADLPAWVQWWNENQKSFVINADPSSNGGGAAPKFNYELAEGSELEYYGIPVVENKIVFVLDMSGSMAFGGKPNRLDKAQEDLKKIIEQLTDKQQFNIIAFASGTNRWKRKDALVPANEMMRKEAAKFIDGLKPLGGTQTADVMEDCIRDIASVSGCEAIYLVTDGSPNPWAKDITSAMQERYITWYNQPWKVRINTVGIYTTTDAEKTNAAKSENIEDMKSFLYNLAANNDGLYREIGK